MPACVHTLTHAHLHTDTCNLRDSVSHVNVQYLTIHPKGYPRGPGAIADFLTEAVLHSPPFDLLPRGNPIRVTAPM